MPNSYKARLAALGLTQTAILPELREKTGMQVNNTELSAAITGVGTQNKHKRIVEAVESILKRYESQTGGDA